MKSMYTQTVLLHRVTRYFSIFHSQAPKLGPSMYVLLPLLPDLPLTSTDAPKLGRPISFPRCFLTFHSRELMRPRWAAARSLARSFLSPGMAGRIWSWSVNRSCRGDKSGSYSPFFLGRLRIAAGENCGDKEGEEDNRQNCVGRMCQP